MKVRSYLETMDVASGERAVLEIFDKLIEAPNWTNDGKLIYNSEGLLYEYDIETGNNRKLDSGYANRCNNDHVLSPDHTRIAVSHHAQEDGLSRIYIFPRAGGEPVLVTPNGPSYLHGWSPDGRMLAYCAERNGQYDIYVIPAEGGDEVRLTDTIGLDDGPEYSPDGEHIWFNSVRTGTMQVWRMRADGSEQIQMTADESNSWFPHVSPDGETIVYLAYRKSDVAAGDHPANKHVELRAMSAQGGAYRVLAKLFGGQGTINVNSWSPDSKRIAFVSYELVEAKNLPIR
ncbi:TolB family protein [Paenibacillus sp. strain BS8-2]